MGKNIIKIYLNILFFIQKIGVILNLWWEYITFSNKHYFNTTIFDNIYCINLDRRYDRWKKCIKEFKKVGIAHKVKRFSAIEHKFGIAGCTLSHLEIIKECKKNKYKNVLIFEDDVEFLHVKNFNKIINDSFRQMRKMGIKYSMFYLGGNLKGNNNKRINTNLVKLDNVKTTYAYIITDKIYDDVIKGLENINPDDLNQWIYSNKKRYSIDYWYTQNIQSKYEVYGVYPMLIKHAAGYSDICGSYEENINDRKKIYDTHHKDGKKWDDLKISNHLF